MFNGSCSRIVNGERCQNDSNSRTGQRLILEIVGLEPKCLFVSPFEAVQSFHLQTLPFTAGSKFKTLQEQDVAVAGHYHSPTMSILFLCILLSQHFLCCEVLPLEDISESTTSINIEDLEYDADYYSEWSEQIDQRLLLTKESIKLL